MHELSIIENIVEIILNERPNRNIKKVKSISLRIGEMRQVVPEALHFGFECVSKNGSSPDVGGDHNILC